MRTAPPPIKPPVRRYVPSRPLPVQPEPGPSDSALAMLLSRLVGRSSSRTLRPPSNASSPRRSVWDAVSSLWRDRLSSEEKELLGWMVRAGSRAHIINEPGRPRHVCIGGRPLLQFGDDFFRTRYVRALERELRRREFVSTFNGVIYELTAKGWTQAQRLR